ncbi:IS110 family RNA-guided transposase (plasmid) [Mycobacterium sp. C3-094]
MMVIGIDAHKATHTLVAVDHRGRKIGEITVPATSAGHARAIRWASITYDGEDLIWGVEDVRTVTARIERDLMDTGAVVVRVPPYLMARVRGSHRVAGKSDPIDALAVARAVLQEPNLPYARHDPYSLACKLMIDRRDNLIRQRTAIMTRLQWRIHQLDPTRDIGQGKLRLRKHRDNLVSWLSTKDGLLAEFSRDEAYEIALLSESITDLHRRITVYVEEVAPSLLAIPGCGVLMAAKIVGETADVTRFRSESAFARFAGVGPLPNWSGSTAGTMRGSRSGNRQINMALHRIAIVQIRLGGLGATYYRMRTEAGDVPSKARRCLKRHLARAVYRALKADHQGREAAAGCR